MKTLVWVEHDNKSLADATLAAVTAAGKLGEVHLLVAGANCRAVADEAAKIAGVGKVHLADDAAYENALAENVAPLIAELMADHDAFVAPATTTGKNVARLSAIRAGLPVTTAATTINRFCSSGLQAIATASQRVIVDKVPVMVAGGVESISLVEKSLNQSHIEEEWLMKHKPELYMAMIETADIVAQRYQVSRASQDEYALISQQRTAAAQEAGRFDDEIVPFDATMLVKDKETRENFGPEVATYCSDACISHGLFLRACAGASIAYCPPLIITKAEVDEMLKRTKTGVDTAYEALKSEGLLNS